MTLGEKIAKLRTEHRLSQSDLAERMGVSRQSISKWETGSSIPDLDKLVSLSNLFEISLDDLVKTQIPIKEMNTRASESSRPSAEYSTRKITGWMLLGTGLLSVVLGTAFNLLLAFLGLYLILCGFICLFIKKHPGLLIGWGTLLPCAFLLPRFSSANMNMIFHPIVYQRAFTLQLVISYALWIALFLLIIATIKSTNLKTHTWLLVGWIVLSQVYGFIPIAFRYTEDTIKYYLILSWCTVIYFLALLFFTGRHLYRHLRIRTQN